MFDHAEARWYCSGLPVADWKGVYGMTDPTYYSQYIGASKGFFKALQSPPSGNHTCVPGKGTWIKRAMLMNIFAIHPGHTLLDNQVVGYLNLRSWDLQERDDISLIWFFEARWSRFIMDPGPYHVLMTNILRMAQMLMPSQEPQFLEKLPRDTCIDQLIVGSPDYGYVPWNSIQPTLGTFEQFSRWLLRRNGMLPKKRARPILTIVQRAETRRFTNLDTVVDRIQQVLPEFDIRFLNAKSPLSVAEDLAAIAESRIMVVIAGSESHFAMFLPPGATLIEINHPYHDRDVNKFLCDNLVAVHCLFVKGLSPVGDKYRSEMKTADRQPKDFEFLRQAPVDIDPVPFTNALKEAAQRG